MAKKQKHEAGEQGDDDDSAAAAAAPPKKKKKKSKKDEEQKRPSSGDEELVEDDGDGSAFERAQELVAKVRRRCRLHTSARPRVESAFVSTTLKVKCFQALGIK